MGTENAPKPEGKQAGKGLQREAAAEERDVEASKGSDLAKGAE